MPGGRPPLASQKLLPSLKLIFDLFSPASPPLCLLPALLLLFSRSVCSPLVVPAPWSYLARFHAPLGLRPVFRPVGRLGRPPWFPLRGASPVVLPRRPPLHQSSDGRAGRPVRLNAGHRLGVSLFESMCSLAPLLAPRSPHLPRPASSACPSLVSCPPFLLFCFFFRCPRGRTLCCYRAPCACPLFFSALPVSHRPAPPDSPPTLCVSSDPACFVRLPSPSEPRCHSCVPPACSTPAPLCRPYPSPWCLSHPSVIPSVPVSHLIPKALSPVWGGGGVVFADWTVALPEDWHDAERTMSHRIIRRNTERTTEMPISFRCICTVDQRRLAEETSCGDSVRSYSNQTRAPRRGRVPAWSPRVHTLLHYFAGCSMEHMATEGLAHSRSAVAKPPEQGTRKSIGINAAPSCHAESFVAR